MCDILNKLDAIKRPRLLISAARIGSMEYRRDTHLTRHFKDGYPSRSKDALEQLIKIESDLDAKRSDAVAGYSVAHHVEVLIAMMGEARILRSAHTH
ncbi:DUF6477 family protein [Roseovarius rhodophyticola]|uniref:DUF6477 family protein n=1 Tax=Roseovarius rhodophyticola TaxID=3080827 RepID=A0ABZ2TE44_9RHOB|nr:DUF6477 family protein [Roseovarius sp. W115]MDV2928169.1 DUF6477 family protein [Roseovarius sp. W115]